MNRTLTAAAVLVALVAGLTACAGTGETTSAATSTTTPASAATTTPAAPETPEPCVPATVGETVATMAEIACAEEAGLIAYRLDAGAVIVDPAAELPQAAVDAIVAPVREKVDDPDPLAVTTAALAAAGYASSQLGRHVLVVTPVRASGGTVYGAYAGEGHPQPGRASVASTASASKAAVDGWVAQQPDTDDYVVLVAE